MQRDIFKRDPNKLQELIRLRTQGLTYMKIGELLGVDHTTCIYNLKRFAPDLAKPFRQRKLTLSEMRRRRKEPMDWIDVLEWEVNCLPLPPTPPKRYKYQYLFDQEDNVVMSKGYKAYIKEGRSRTPETAKEYQRRIVEAHQQRMQERGPLLTDDQRNYIRNAVGEYLGKVSRKTMMKG